MEPRADFARTAAARLAAVLAPLAYERAIFFEHARDDEQGKAERLSCARLVIDGAGDVRRWPQRWQPELPGTALWAQSETPWIDDVDTMLDCPADAAGTLVRNLVNVQQLRRAGIHALLAAAVYENGEIVGSVAIGSTTPGAYGPAERDLIRQPKVADVLRDLVAELAEQRRLVLRSLRDAFKPDVPIEALAETLVTRLATANDWDFVGIYRVERQFEMVASCDRTRGKVLKINPDYQQNLNVGMLGSTLAAGTCLRADDVTTDPPPYGYSAVEGFKARSALCYPIFVSGRIEWILDCASTAVAAFRGPDRGVLDELVQGLQLTLNLWFETRLSKAILNGLTEAVLVTDRDGLIQRSNSAGRSLFGLAKGVPVQIAGFAADEDSRRLLDPVRPLSDETLTLTTALLQPREMIVTVRRSSDAFGQFVFRLSDKGHQEWLAGLDLARKVVETEVGRTRVALMLAGALVAGVRATLKAGGSLDAADAILQRVGEAIISTNLSYDRLAGAMIGRTDERQHTLVVNTLVEMANSVAPGIANGSAATGALGQAMTTVARYLTGSDASRGTPS